jgi:hypothetical protein
MLSRLQHADASAKDMVGKVEARLDAFERGMNQMYAGRSPLRALDLVEPSRELSAAERAVLVEIGSAMERIWDTQRPQEPFGALTSAQRAMWDSLRGEFARGTFGTRWPTAEQDLAGFAAELCADLSGALGDREWVGRLSADRMEAKDVLGRYAGREDGRAARTVIAALQTGAVVDAKSALLAWRRATNR